jgi:uncharacterized protein YjbI with pentapeptide repeats
MVTMSVMRFAKRWWLNRRPGRRVVPHEEPLRVMRWWPVTTVVVFVVVSGSALTMWLLGVWAPISKGTLDPDRLRLDRIKTGLTVAAGLAAGVTLLMALRRQALSERVQRFAESDALEQRTTALYVAAAEQLGSDKAAVRLAGLYALERLGQDNPKLRQTVFDVWCAYLRMPYTLPVDVFRRNVEASPERPVPDAEPPDPGVEAERWQELEVRLTAQRLLGTHLRLGRAETETRTYWSTNEANRLVVDLAGAVLVDFDASTWTVGHANFRGAQFHGDASLAVAQFHGQVDLHEAKFHGHANLAATEFHGYADLAGTEFHGNASLAAGQFRDRASLIGAKFHGRTNLAGTEFHGDAYLYEAQFHGYAVLFGAKFYGRADLREAQFSGDLDMRFVSVTPATRLPDGWRLSAITSQSDKLLPVVCTHDALADHTGW